MIVADLMQRDLKTANPEAMIGEAIVTLADGHVSALPVVDAQHRLIGVLSTTDILEAEAACEGPEERERLFAESMVKEIMTPRPVSIGSDANVREAAQQMLYLEVHRLFVEDKGKLVGVISQSDVVRAVALAKV